MIRNIHFDDNIFFLNSLIKALKTGLSLDIDEDYFIDKILEDLFFINNTLKRILNSLKNNSKLINQRELFRSLLKTEQKYLNLINEIMSEKTVETLNFKPYLPKILTVKKDLEEDIDDIDECLSYTGETDRNTELVSSEEFKFLFKDDSEE